MEMLLEMAKEIKLGSKVKDIMTGFVGVVTARTEYYNGCIRYLTEGFVGADGKMPAPEYFDVGQLEVIDEERVKAETAPAEEKKTPGGPARMEAPR